MPIMVAMAKLGQHFLVNRGVAKKIVAHFQPRDGTILEIGPGKGVLTLLMAEKWPQKTILAVEVDEDLARRLGPLNLANLRIVQQDIRSLQLDEVTESPPFNIIGNIPYYISKEIIDWLISQHALIGQTVLMVQKEFADKLLLRTGTLLPHSLMVHLLFVLTKLFDVNPGSFAPPPEVTSTVLALTERDRLPVDNIRAFYAFVKQCFRNQRKTLANNLRRSMEPERLESVFRDLEIPATIRAGQLSLGTYIDLFRKLDPWPEGYPE